MLLGSNQPRSNSLANSVYELPSLAEAPFGVSSYIFAVRTTDLIGPHPRARRVIMPSYKCVPSRKSDPRPYGIDKCDIDFAARSMTMPIDELWLNAMFQISNPQPRIRRMATWSGAGCSRWRVRTDLAKAERDPHAPLLEERLWLFQCFRVVLSAIVHCCARVVMDHGLQRCQDYWIGGPV